MKQLRFAGEAFADERKSLALAREWQKKKFDAGWACLVWPKAYGGQGLGPAENVIFQEEEGPFAELCNLFLIGQGFVAPTLMAYATEAQKQRFLPAIASGESIWCQLFSEPGAGSDLAAVRTRAERHGNVWRINGQKVWTSGAHYSEWGIALVRTDAGVPKHGGMTMFFVNMAAPGVTVRPIRQLSGAAHFNEVFFDEVEVPDEQRLGEVNGGWRVALTTLMNERMTLGASVPVGFDEVFSLASQPAPDGSAHIDSEHVRMRLADWYARVTGMRFGVYRQLTAMSQGVSPGAEAAVGKLIGASTTQEIAAFGLDLLGARGRASARDRRAGIRVPLDVRLRRDSPARGRYGRSAAQRHRRARSRPAARRADGPWPVPRCADGADGQGLRRLHARRVPPRHENRGSRSTSARFATRSGRSRPV